MEIETEPTTRTCSGCDKPIQWLWSARKKAWVAFSPSTVEKWAIVPHEHAPTPQADWRNTVTGPAAPASVRLARRAEIDAEIAAAKLRRAGAPR